MTRFVIASCLLVLTACADDTAGDPTPDAAAPRPDADPGDGCDETAQLPTQWRPIDLVSTGAVAVTSAGGVTSGTIDATAGGTAGAPDNPYIYVDLAAGERVGLTDVDALGDAAWHVAFKRSSIRVNGGDSGPGGVTAAAVAADSLAAVTTMPPPGELGGDDWVDDACALVTLPGGEPATRIGEWYDYDPATHQLSPKPNVYVIRLVGGDAYKLRITTYYGDSAMPMRGAFYGVEWAPL